MTSYSWFQSKLDQRWGYILHANVWPLEWKTESGHGLSLCLTLRLSLEGPWDPGITEEAPIWLGEFGTNGYWTTAVWWMEVGEVLWLRHLLRYMRLR